MGQVSKSACGRSLARAGRTSHVPLQDTGNIAEDLHFLMAALKQLCIEVSNLLLALLEPNAVRFGEDDCLGALKLFEGSGNRDTHDFLELSLNLLRAVQNPL